MAIGLLGGVICYLSVSVVKAKLGYDDSLDAFGVHGVGGAWGALATGLFASKAVNEAGADGLLFGNAAQFTNQVIGVAASCLFAAVMTFVIIKIMGLVMDLRVSEAQEMQGLDLSEHGERGYSYQDLVTGSPVSFAALESQPVPATKTSMA